MYASATASRLRLPVLALVLSLTLLVLYIKSDLNISQPIPVGSADPLPVLGGLGGPEEVDHSVEGAGEGLLFDNAPAEVIQAEEELLVPEPPKKPKNAIVTAIWDSSYASLALMLGFSITQHNDLAALDAELVLLTLHPDADRGQPGLSDQNRTLLTEKAGWRISETYGLEVPGVNMLLIQKHRRHNLNKLKIFGWEEYDRIVFLDADTFVKGSIAPLLELPSSVEFAGAPDGWPQIEIDPKFNSGVMVFTPKMKTYEEMLIKLSDPAYHDVKEGDQQFLQNFWKYRDWRLPVKFNLNLVHVAWHPQLWERTWPDVRIVHFTDRKPSEKWTGTGWCERPVTRPPVIGKGECGHMAPLLDYRREFEKMQRLLGLEHEIGTLG